MNPATQSAEQEKRKTYKGKYKPTWCPGCGDYSILGAIDRALVQFGRPEWEVAIVSGIGCSSRFPYFMNTYGFHAAHGRALSLATGLKVARPDITVIATGGDGDALAIGGNHFFHTMRRNVDLTYILMDNQIYGMTKGQAAPTSQLGAITKSSPFGTVEAPVDPVWCALTMGATFVAQSATFALQQITDLIYQGLCHPGIAFINVLSPCVTYHKEMTKDYIKDRSFQIEEERPGYDPGNLLGALTLLRESEGRFPLGLLHRRIEPAYEERLGALARHSREEGESGSLQEILKEFL